MRLFHTHPVYSSITEFSFCVLSCFGGWSRFEPQGHLLGKEYFLHAYGPIYALSQEVVQIITSIKDGV